MPFLRPSSLTSISPLAAVFAVGFAAGLLVAEPRLAFLPVAAITMGVALAALRLAQPPQHPSIWHVRP